MKSIAKTVAQTAGRRQVTTSWLTAVPPVRLAASTHVARHVSPRHTSKVSKSRSNLRCLWGGFTNGSGNERPHFSGALGGLLPAAPLLAEGLERAALGLCWKT